ncbi:MAG: putative sensor protein [Anaerocolumna sp.]|nr:putative sensor protein [Anaerocolumna sp.]
MVPVDILDTTPNIILIVDSDMKIIEFSGKAEDYFHVSKSKASEMYLYEIIDSMDFEKVLNTHEPIIGKKVTYPKLNLTTLQSIVYVEKQNAVL